MKIQVNPHLVGSSSTPAKVKKIQSFANKLEDPHWRKVFYQSFVDYFIQENKVNKYETELARFQEKLLSSKREQERSRKNFKTNEVIPRVKEWLKANWQMENLLIVVLSKTYTSTNDSRIRKIIQLNENSVIGQKHGSWETYETGFSGIQHFLIDSKQMSLEEIAEMHSPLPKRTIESLPQPESDLTRLYLPIFSVDSYFNGDPSDYHPFNKWLMADLMLQCFDLDAAEGVLDNEFAEKCIAKMKERLWESSFDSHSIRMAKASVLHEIKTRLTK